MVDDMCMQVVWYQVLQSSHCRLNDRGRMHEAPIVTLTVQ